jgi:hypothetical protein
MLHYRATELGERGLALGRPRGRSSRRERARNTRLALRATGLERAGDNRPTPGSLRPAEAPLPPNAGSVTFRTHRDWHNLLPFHEYFHGDAGRGAGACHQTGWTALVADLVVRRRPRRHWERS